MIKTLRAWIIAFVFVGLAGGSFMSLTAPTTTYAAGCTSRVLTFPTWYNGLGENKDGGCEIKQPGSGPKGLSNFIWAIALNVIEIALQLVGYLSVGFIIYGGFKYITGMGASDKIVAARKIIQNAVIGLVISLFSVAIVNLAGRGF